MVHDNQFEEIGFFFMHSLAGGGDNMGLACCCGLAPLLPLPDPLPLPLPPLPLTLPLPLPLPPQLRGDGFRLEETTELSFRDC